MVSNVGPNGSEFRLSVGMKGVVVVCYKSNHQSVEPTAAERGTPWGDFVRARNALIKHLHAQGLSFGSISLEVSTGENAVIRIVEREEK